MDMWFKNNLSTLLPYLYQQYDETGDLKVLLELFAQPLDELKNDIDELPKITDIENCDEKFLLLIAPLVGLPVDGKRSSPWLRRRITEAVPIYRRKGTSQALKRDLSNNGWQGELQETFRKALRLNTRAGISVSKLPGLIYSLGVFRIQCHTQTNALREVLAFHQPAGTFCYWQQMLFETIENTFETHHAITTKSTFLSKESQTFVLGQSLLGSHKHLTYKRKMWEQLQLTMTTTVTANTSHTLGLLNRWQQVESLFILNANKLNLKQLSQTQPTNDQACLESLENITSEMSTLRLGQTRLNRSGLRQTIPTYRWL